MKKPIVLLTVAVFGLAFCLTGCQSLCPCKSGGKSQAKADPTLLCGSCGNAKGAAACCQSAAATCAKCDLAKGSPGCCAMEKGGDATVCTKCGLVKGSAECCKTEGKAVCGKCSLVAGSPGCKLECAKKT